MMLILCVISLLFSLLLYKLLIKNPQYANLPPGPKPLPLLGNMLEMNDIFKCSWAARYRKTYGPIFTMWSGSRPMVFLADYDIIKEALSDGNKFAARPRGQDLYEEVTGGTYGILINSGNDWQEHRRFALKTLRDFGMGRNVMESKILVEADSLTAGIAAELSRQQKPGSSVDVGPHILLCVVNIISSLVVGETFALEDARFKFWTKTIDDISAAITGVKANVLQTLRWIRFVPILGHYIGKDLERLKNDYMGFIKDVVKRKKAEFQPDEEQTDYASAYLAEMHRRKAEGGPESDYLFSEVQLCAVISDLWSAGLETTTATLRYTILLMALHEDVQTKVRQEIWSVIGKDRQPNMSDKQQMPYTYATINETQRWANIVPLNIPHTVWEDGATLRGYFIPKNTPVIPQIGAVLHDEQVFPDPEKFDPARFLDAQGNLVTKAELIPFSMGKRSCLGESLARMELFLIFTSVLQKLSFSVDPADPPSLEPAVRFVLSPQPYKVLAKIME